MRNFIIGAVIGLLGGAAMVFFMFVGAPRAANRPGVAIEAPDTQTKGGAQVVIKADLLNQVLGTIFRDMQPPAFPLQVVADGDETPRYESAQANACDGQIHIIQEGSGVRTGVSFKDGKIAAPIAFSGSFNSAFGCIPIQGWAQTHLDLRFDVAQQAVYGIVTVETVNLDGVNPLVSGIVTPLVQGTLNNRVNPILLLRGEQIGVDVPVTSAGGKLQARASDIRAEVKDDALMLTVDYNFEGQKAGSGT
ncbi:MAG TPA: hypothetical protein VGO43_02995 [Pyrinomonadaceae bacterium]|jgi:hypothetical protein|nr:hypothetical protein [Pyrinomonadaceae bacterium]